MVGEVGTRNEEECEREGSGSSRMHQRRASTWQPRTSGEQFRAPSTRLLFDNHDELDSLFFLHIMRCQRPGYLPLSLFYALGSVHSESAYTPRFHRKIVSISVSFLAPLRSKCSLRARQKWSMSLQRASPDKPRCIDQDKNKARRIAET